MLIGHFVESFSASLISFSELGSVIHYLLIIAAALKGIPPSFVIDAAIVYIINALNPEV